MLAVKCDVRDPHSVRDVVVMVVFVVVTVLVVV